MNDIESLEEFYTRKLDWIPENFNKEIGHFNLFRLEPYVEGKPTNIPYRRRDFYKIMLVKGNSKVHYADKVVEVKKQALSFSNPQIPYKWEHLDQIREGVFCVFDAQFFHRYNQFQDYEIFQPNGSHIFELKDKQVETVHEIFDLMRTELNSNYKYKYDLIRNFILELVHFGLKLEPSVEDQEKSINASQRISILFLNLLERQFPIDTSHHTIGLRSASDFAYQLNVHVNHLNRAVRETTDKTTTRIISDRILQESKVLLRHTSWNVSEIAYSLGFREVTHFNNFFKKHVQQSPIRFRNQ